MLIVQYKNLPEELKKNREIYTIFFNIDDLWDKKSLIWTSVIIKTLSSHVNF